MRKIKDRVILGAISGIIAGGIGKGLSAIWYKAGWSEMRFNQPAASLFLTHKEAKKNTLAGKTIASLVNNTMLGTSGVIVAYMLSFTGRDYAIIKGAGVGMIQWIGIWGVFSKLRVTIKSYKPLTHLLRGLDHMIYGAIMGFLVSKLGDESLFPDHQQRTNKKKTAADFGAGLSSPAIGGIATGNGVGTCP